MSYASDLIDDVFTVRWKEPTLPDVDAVVREVNVAANRLGRAVHYIAIIPADSKPPSDDVRKAMMASMDAIMKNTTDLHFIIEGGGFKHAILRSALTTITFVAAKRASLHVHATVQEALAKIFASDPPRDSYLKGAAAKGLLT